MKQSIFWIIALSIFLGACSQKVEDKTKKEKLDLIEKITQLEQELINNETKHLNYKPAQQVEKLYKEFIRKFPTDTAAPEYLYKCAEVNVGLGKYHAAAELFQNMQKSYPNHPKTPQSLFLAAFVYDTHLDQKGKAETIYRKVIELYPGTQYAKDAEIAIQTLHLSNEELLKMLQEKAKQQSDSTTLQNE
jgi:TolA-binding protein